MKSIGIGITYTKAKYGSREEDLWRREMKKMIREFTFTHCALL